MWGTWNNIINAKMEADSIDIVQDFLFYVYVGIGDDIIVWSDTWFDLSSRFPAIYDLAKCKSVCVSKRIANSVFVGIWKKATNSSREIVELNQLQTLVASFKFSQSNGI